MHLHPLLTFLILVFPILVLSQNTINVNTNSMAINTLATYTFTLTFNSPNSRTQFYLFFPSQLTLSNNTTVQLGGLLLNSSLVTIY